MVVKEPCISPALPGAPNCWVVNGNELINGVLVMVSLLAPSPTGTVPPGAPQPPSPTLFPPHGCSVTLLSVVGLQPQSLWKRWRPKIPNPPGAPRNHAALLGCRQGRDCCSVSSTPYQTLEKPHWGSVMTIPSPSQGAPGASSFLLGLWWLPTGPILGDFFLF